MLTFGREQRVRRHADYVRIQSGSERITTRHFYFLIAPSPAPLARLPRLGLIVTRKLGGAVVRNRIKR
ncbi:MAG TPA: ribonuclease P protein component, partial [Polyangiaceae bacterium]|nr:ribonuclease P protein component [Polyangiaceae bacterium]